VRVLSRWPVDTTSTFQGARWYQGDFRHPIEPAFLNGVDTLYHLAAELTNSAQMEAVNVQGTANLLTAAAEVGVFDACVSAQQIEAILKKITHKTN
jgi:nucleoside-diphosphate-sugar epimerase